MLTHLHISVVQNIVFCFTFSQISSGVFGPGEGYKVLKSFLEKDIKSGIVLKPGENVFFIENEAYRFLVSKKNKYPWTEDQELQHSQSWNHSVKEIKKMFSYILTIPPHNLEDTISLNNAKKIVVDLSEVIFRLSQNIENNIDHIENLTKQLHKDVTKKEMLKTTMKMKLNIIVKELLASPKLVCEAKNCCKIENNEKIYTTICHEPCYCFFSNGTIGMKFFSDIKK